jgi:hypothetical protein
MRYVLTQDILGCPHCDELTEAEFSDIELCTSRLLHVLFFEEKLNYVLDNYIEFERELINTSLDYAYDRSHIVEDGRDRFHAIHRRIVNLLSTGRMYLDQLEHHLSAIYPNDAHQREALTKTKADEYDHKERPSYRFVEALRNYVQHRGFAIHGISHRSRLVGEPIETRIRNMIVPEVNASQLADDPKFKKNVLHELQKTGNKIDIRPLIRDYVDSIRRIHQQIRASLSGDVDKWDRQLKSIIGGYVAKFGGNALALTARALGKNSRIVRAIPIYEGTIQRRQELQRRNKRLAECACQFVSNEIDTGK